jgi:hypothetical protein
MHERGLRFSPPHRKLHIIRLLYHTPYFKLHTINIIYIYIYIYLLYLKHQFQRSSCVKILQKPPFPFILNQPTVVTSFTDVMPPLTHVYSLTVSSTQNGSNKPTASSVT